LGVLKQKSIGYIDEDEEEPKTKNAKDMRNIEVIKRVEKRIDRDQEREELLTLQLNVLI
jgi:hypothetical protein